MTKAAEMKPQQIDQVTMAFPANIYHLMPNIAEIPRTYDDDKWRRFQRDWFFHGFKEGTLKLTPKEGIDSEKAWRHLAAIQRSFQPKHEHKEAAVAYLASLWFEDITYEKAD